MKFISIFLFLLSFILLSTKPALAKRQIDDDTGSVVDAQKYMRFRAADSSESKKSPSIHRKYVEETNETRVPYKEAQTAMELRKLRRMGIGLQAAGALGVGGAILDLNFAPQWSVTTGFGGGGGFQSFELSGKYVIAGDWLMPYLNFGYAHWGSTSTGAINKTSPALLGDRLLNDAERATGEFSKNLLYPGIGLQFTQLDGPWAGSSVYAEFNFLIDVVNQVAAPTGALGFAYYF